MIGTPLASDLTLKRGYDHTVRASISALILFIVALALLIAGWLTVRSVADDRARAEQSASKKAREVSHAIDRELLAAKSILTALVSSHYLQNGNVFGFYNQAKQVADQLGVNIVLRDPAQEGAIFNTRRPWGVASGTSPAALAMEQQALRSNGVFVSNVFFGRNTRKYLVAVAQPVHTGDQVYVLALLYGVEKFIEVVRGAQLEDQWIATVVGRDDVILARSELPEKYVGTHIASSWPSDALEDSVKFGSSRDGIPFHWFSHRSTVTGWRTSVGVPDSVLDASSKVAVASFVFGSGLLLAVGFIVAHRLGGSVSKTIGELEAAALTERRRGDEQFRTLFESVPNGIVAVDLDGRIALVNARVEEMFGYARQELIGQPIEVLVPERLRARHVDLRWAFSRAACARPMGAARDLAGRRKDGSEFPI